MRTYKIDQSAGCLIFILILVALFGVLRLAGGFLFGTQIGWAIVGLFVVRQIWIMYKKSQISNVKQTYTYDEQYQKSEGNLDKEDPVINADSIVDVDYVEVVELDKKD